MSEHLLWGVFAAQIPAMLRYARTLRGLGVEPPSESRPSPFGLRITHKLNDHAIRFA
jgi:hypothetical protein